MQGHSVSVSHFQVIESLANRGAAAEAKYCLPSCYNPPDSSPFPQQTSSAEGVRKPLALVVDDAPDLADMLSVFLIHSGYEVVTANSATAAIEAAKSALFDVVISDIGMPRMNGYQLAEILRALPDYTSVPLIAVTGFSLYNDRERSLNAGFNAHVTKPIDPEGLFELIEKLRG